MKMLPHYPDSVPPPPRFDAFRRRLAPLVLSFGQLLVGVAASTSALASPFAYLPNPGQPGQDTVSVVDLGTSAVLATIPVGNVPVLVEGNPAGTKVYAPNFFDDSVSVIDTATNTVSATIPVRFFPAEIDVSPDGSLVYVVNHFDGVDVIDGDTDTFIKTISHPWSRRVIGGTLNPAGTELWVPDPGEGVEVLDLATETFFPPIALGGGTLQAAFSPSGARAYISQNAASSVAVIDTLTKTVVGSIPVGQGVGALRVDDLGTFLYVTNGLDDTVSKIDLATESVVATFNVGDNPSGLDLSPDGRFLYTVDEFTVSVTVIDVQANQVVNTILPGFTTVDAFGSGFIVDPSDTTPDAFAFSDQIHVARSSQRTSNTVAISGINRPAPISVTGGEFSIGCTTSFSSAPTNISNGQTVCVRHTASASPNTAVDTTLSVGGVTDTFTSTTALGNTALQVQAVPYVLVTQGLQIRILLSPTATLKDADINMPISGRMVIFSAGGTSLCTATTNESGVARCQANLPIALRGLLDLGYTATFNGDALYQPSTKKGDILGMKLF